MRFRNFFGRSLSATDTSSESQSGESASRLAAVKQKPDKQPGILSRATTFMVQNSGRGGLPGSDPVCLAEEGVEVCARLDQVTDAVRIKSSRIDLYAIPNFMSEAECQRMMTLIDADVKPSIALKANPGSVIRTSHTCRLFSSDPFVMEIESRITALTGIENVRSETVQGQRYTAGQYFKVHNDYIAAGQSYSQVFADEGGQRTWTAMAYLNNVEGGGHTNFPFVPIRFPPRTGVLLLWNNLARDGLPNLFSQHEGEAVMSGTKYVLTKWFREREWQGSEASDALRK